MLDDIIFDIDSPIKISAENLLKPEGVVPIDQVLEDHVHFEGDNRKLRGYGSQKEIDEAIRRLNRDRDRDDDNPPSANNRSADGEDNAGNSEPSADGEDNRATHVNRRDHLKGNRRRETGRLKWETHSKM